MSLFNSVMAESVKLTGAVIVVSIFNKLLLLQNYQLLKLLPSYRLAKEGNIGKGL